MEILKIICMTHFNQETYGQFFADKIMDLANLAMAALVFGQLGREGSMDWFSLAGGFFLFWVCVIISYILRRIGRDSK